MSKWPTRTEWANRKALAVRRHEQILQGLHKNDLQQVPSIRLVGRLLAPHGKFLLRGMLMLGTGCTVTGGFGYLLGTYPAVGFIVLCAAIFLLFAYVTGRIFSK